MKKKKPIILYFVIGAIIFNFGVLAIIAGIISWENQSYNNKVSLIVWTSIFMIVGLIITIMGLVKWRKK